MDRNYIVKLKEQCARIDKLYDEENSLDAIANLCHMSMRQVHNRLTRSGKINTVFSEERPSLRKGIFMSYNGYVRIHINGKWILEHRYIWEKVHGPLPKGWVVHHLNGIKDDNRLVNLFAMPRDKHSREIMLADADRNRICQLEERVAELEALIEGYEQILDIGQ